MQFEQWSRHYGPIYTLWIGRQPAFISADPVVAVDLLEKRSTKYSSRLRMIALAELYSRNNSNLVQPYEKQWSLRRKLMHSSLTPSMLSLYKPTQEAEALCIGYGHRIDSLNACVIRLRLKFMRFQAQISTLGCYMVDTIPALKYIPAYIAPWKREVQQRGMEEGQANHSLFHQVRSELDTASARGEKDTVPYSMARHILKVREKGPVPLTDGEALSKIIWASDILPATDKTTGHPIAYDTYAYTEGINVRPRPFQIRLNIRSERHRALLSNDRESAMSWLERFTPFGEE